MDNYLYKAINKYYKTLQVTGTISKEDKYSLFIISTIYSIYKSFGKLFTKDDLASINKYLRCLVKNKCVLGRNIPCLEFVNDGDSLITIIDSDVIETTNGINMVSTDRQTQKFTDFTVRTDIQADQYIVGYDESDNKEVAINIKDLGVFWEN